MKRSQLSTAIRNAMLLPACAVLAHNAMAQNAPQTATGGIEEVVVTGIQASLQRAMDLKRDRSIVSDGIAAEDLGKFPDTNVAESLQRITGVSIDRSGGEGQNVTVRGFGPSFNTVLVNGRQMATDSDGRQFNFDILSAEMIRGADVFKSSSADMQSGGIGSTINVRTARPFDFDGLQLVGSAKGTYESISEETNPSVSGLISNTFADETFGILAAFSYTERNNQINSLSTSGWRPGLDLSDEAGIANDPGTVVASNVTIPRNFGQQVTQEARERLNANLSVQFSPNEDMMLTFDGFHSSFEIDGTTNELAAWFEPNRVTDVEFNPDTRTVTRMNNIGRAPGRAGQDAATDFVVDRRTARDSEFNALALNFDWQVNESLSANFDIAYSDAENDMAGKGRFNVIGMTNDYTFNADTATSTHAGFNGSDIPPTSRARMHVNERQGDTDKDEIQELKADFEFTPDSRTFTKMNFGGYYQEREKEYFAKSSNLFGVFGGYFGPIPEELDFRPFTADNFFSGVQDTWYTYDAEQLFNLMETDESLADANDQAINDAFGPGTREVGTTWQAIQNAPAGGGFTPTLNGDEYTIEEDITSVYVDFTFDGTVGDLPWTVNFGTRYEQTTTSSTGLIAPLNDIVATGDPTLFANVLGDPTSVTQKASYADLLPSLNAKLELREDMVVRYAAYETITRPTLDQLTPSINFGEPRRQTLTAAAGNPDLQPFTAENWDVSFEWYYNDASYLSAAFFNKEVANFIVNASAIETFGLSDRQNTPENSCASDDCQQIYNGPDELSPELIGPTEDIRVSRPRNAEIAEVDGVELAWTHTIQEGMFQGFGITLNATEVDSNATVDTENRDQDFALIGLGNSQNAVVFYERYGFQVRAAFNNREGFLQTLSNPTTGEPVLVDSYGQWDLSGSYDVNDNLTVFFEGVNVTEEELVSRGRQADQIVGIVDSGARWALGLRARF